MSQQRLVVQAHASLAELLDDGDTVVDATVGNGHDTLFLAQQVGDRGKVYGFDIQQDALDETYRRLEVQGLSQRASLYHAGHEVMLTVLPESTWGKVKAVVFNLGYLPGGDKRQTTSTITTLAALEQARELLTVGGVISVLAYTGHPGGRDEAEAVKQWAGRLSPDYYHLRTTIPATDADNAPEWVLITRR